MPVLTHQQRQGKWPRSEVLLAVIIRFYSIYGEAVKTSCSDQFILSVKLQWQWGAVNRGVFKGPVRPRWILISKCTLTAVVLMCWPQTAAFFSSVPVSRCEFRTAGRGIKTHKDVFSLFLDQIILQVSKSNPSYWSLREYFVLAAGLVRGNPER